MAILSNSWAQHFRSITVNNEANKNMRAFTDAFAPTKTLAKRVNTLVKEVDSAVFLVGMSGTVLQTHSWLKFGGTHFCPNFFIASLIGMGPRASAVIMNHSVIWRQQQGGNCGGNPGRIFALTHFVPPASVSAKILVGAQKSIFPGLTSSAERAF
jgi:hypothetical protein